MNADKKVSSGGYSRPLTAHTDTDDVTPQRATTPSPRGRAPIGAACGRGWRPPVCEAAVRRASPRSEADWSAVGTSELWVRFC